jgi:DnaB-like helicase C terminal domain
LSVEHLLVAALVEDGSPRKAYQAGISRDDFQLYEEEFNWLEGRADENREISQRTFQTHFPEFDWVLPRERIPELIREFNDERAFVELNALLEQVSQKLEYDNATTLAAHVRDVSSEILRKFDAQPDVNLKSDFEKHMEHMRNLRILRKQGVLPGIPTGISLLDNHWDGYVDGRLVVVLGRPGEGKSIFIANSAVAGMLDKRKIGMFSPEMNEFEHRCRIHTLLSAKREIQEACDLKTAFSNRALMRGEGFNIKAYRRFVEYLASLEGEITLFHQRYRRDKMTPAFINSKIEDLGLDMVIVDPIYKLKSPRLRGDRLAEVTDTVDALQGIGEFNNIPVLITNQARRQGMTADAPGMDDSFGADAPAQEADHVISIKYITPERRLILRCTKSRFGDRFRVELRFYPDEGKLMPIVESDREEDDE